jgi:peptidoglycan/xylan/chitin deacetylase (PgdA/CDA1 family)
MRAHIRRCVVGLAGVSLAFALGCGSSRHRDTLPTGLGATAPLVREVAPSGLPIPATKRIAKPSGIPGNVTVLDWAGFKAATSWTFDDSQPSHLAHYAALNAVGVPMTFYINSANSEGAAYEAAWTKAVHDGHELGNHSVHHCHADLTGCMSGTPLATLGDELDACSTYITGHTTQTAVWTMASPFGDHGYDAAAVPRFLASRGVSAGSVGPGDTTDPYKLPVHPVTEGETAATMNRHADAARNAGRWLIFLVHTITPTDAVWYAPVEIGELTSAMRTAAARVDVWTDTVVAIAAYWRAQKIFQSLAPTVAGNIRTWTWTLPAHFPPGKYLRVKVDGGTLTQGIGSSSLIWDPHGYYEVALDAGTLTLAP